MSKDMDTPFLSFSNPNYQFEDTVNSNISGTSRRPSDPQLYEEVDVNIMSMANHKQEKSKLQNGELGSQHSLDDEVASLKSDDISSDEDNDFVDSDSKFVEAETDLLDEKVNNSECIDTNPYSENKPRGILAYISLLEASARERRNERKKALGGTDNDPEETDSGQITPSISDTLKDKTFENQGFEINSPDSNDSGIQSDARSDDGISHLHSTGAEDQDRKDRGEEDEEKEEEEDDDDEQTPTQTEDGAGDQPEVLPPGWERCEDEDGPYYWHIKSGTIQREPPSPAPPDLRETLRSISINSDSSTVSAESMPSTPSSVTSTEDHLQEFEDHALQYAVKSLQNLSSQNKPGRAGYQDTVNGEKPVRYAVSSLGWVPIPEEDLMPERSSKAVNKCIMDLTLGRNDINDVVGRWGDGKDLYMDLDTDSLRLVDPQDFSVLNYQPIHTIRVWGVGRENGRDFAYVARDKLTRVHMCHVFRCDTPARHIANTLREICKKIMMERTIQQNALNRLTRPTDLPNLEPATTQPNGQKHSFQALYSNASFPTPMEEPKKVLRCHYLGSEDVNKPTGMDVLNSSIERICKRVPAERWKFVSVAVAPSTITITEHGKPENKIEESRVRYLSFMGISIANVKMCAFIVHKPGDKFCAHVFHCEPSAGPLCKTIEAACKLRYQKCLDAQHRHANKQKGNQQSKPENDDPPPSPGAIKTSLETVQKEVKSGVQKVQTTVKPVLQTVQTGVKAGVMSVQSGMKAGVHGVQSGVKAGVQSVTNVFSMWRNKRSEES